MDSEPVIAPGNARWTSRCILAVVLIAPDNSIGVMVTAASLILLALLGVLSAKAGGSPVLRATLRVTFWGALAMAATALVGSLFGTTAA